MLRSVWLIKFPLTNAVLHERPRIMTLTIQMTCLRKTLATFTALMIQRTKSQASPSTSLTWVQSKRRKDVWALVFLVADMPTNETTVASLPGWSSVARCSSLLPGLHRATYSRADHASVPCAQVTSMVGRQARFCCFIAWPLDMVMRVFTFCDVELNLFKLKII